MTVTRTLTMRKIRRMLREIIHTEEEEEDDDDNENDDYEYDDEDEDHRQPPLRVKCCQLSDLPTLRYIVVNIRPPVLTDVWYIWCLGRTCQPADV